MSLSQSKKWLIIRNGAVGDTLLLSPVVQAVRDQHPDASIEVMGNLDRIALLVGDGLADQATAFDQPGIASLFVGDVELPLHLQDYFNGFDVIVYYGQSRLEDIRSKFKVNEEQIVITHPALPDADDVHITEHYFQAIQSLINIDKPYIPRIVLTEDEMDWGKQWLSQHAEPLDNFYVLGLHVGAGSKLKRAPFELFHQKIRDVGSNKKPLLMIPKGPADDEVVEEFIDTLSKDILTVTLEGMKLRELASVLSYCDEFMGNDSGITHMAAALSIPAIAAFVTGDPNVWKPLGDHVRVVDLIS